MRYEYLYDYLYLGILTFIRIDIFSFCVRYNYTISYTFILGCTYNYMSGNFIHIINRFRIRVFIFICVLDYIYLKFAYAAF